MIVASASPELTHRDLCRAVARWFLRQVRWCDVVAWELGGYVLEHERRRDRELTLAELVAQAEGTGGSVFDVVALTSVSHQEHLAELATRRHRHPPAPRLAVVEVKRTRSDLLGDLRRGKLRKYEVKATHCYLAATPEALGIERPSTRQAQEQLEALELAGLPRTWGVLLLHVGDGWAWPSLVRNPRRLPTQVTPRDRQDVAVRVARSLAFRVLGQASPMEETP